MFNLVLLVSCFFTFIIFLKKPLIEGFSVTVYNNSKGFRQLWIVTTLLWVKLRWITQITKWCFKLSALWSTSQYSTFVIISAPNLFSYILVLRTEVIQIDCVCLFHLRWSANHSKYIFFQVLSNTHLICAIID